MNVSVMTERIKNLTSGFQVWVSLQLQQTVYSQHKASSKDQLLDPVVLKIGYMSIIYHFSLSELTSPIRLIPKLIMKQTALN